MMSVFATGIRILKSSTPVLELLLTNQMTRGVSNQRCNPAKFIKVFIIKDLD